MRNYGANDCNEDKERKAQGVLEMLRFADNAMDTADDSPERVSPDGASSPSTIVIRIHARHPDDEGDFEEEEFEEGFDDDEELEDDEFDVDDELDDDEDDDLDIDDDVDDLDDYEDDDLFDDEDLDDDYEPADDDFDDDYEDEDEDF